MADSNSLKTSKVGLIQYNGDKIIESKDGFGDGNDKVEGVANPG